MIKFKLYLVVYLKPKSKLYIVVKFRLNLMAKFSG
jgi:hypothetical protein